MIALRDQLWKIVEHAPDDMRVEFSAGWLREKLQEEEPGTQTRTADGLSLEEVGAQLHAAAGTVRKYIREGKRGKSGRIVFLRSFPGVGGQRVTEEALAQFVRELQKPAEIDPEREIRIPEGLSVREEMELGRRLATAQRGKGAAS